MKIQIAPDNTAPVVGLRFLHRRVLDTAKFDGKTAQLYQVTRIARGVVYYRPVFDLGFPGERLGSVECCLVGQFSSFAV